MIELTYTLSAGLGSDEKFLLNPRFVIGVYPHSSGNTRVDSVEGDKVKAHFCQESVQRVWDLIEDAIGRGLTP